MPAPTPTQTSPPKATITSAPIQVLIKGQVVNPGKYVLQKESRLMDLIQIAGGLTDLADESRVNDVFILRDGDYFYIPTSDEVIPETARNAAVNIPLGDIAVFDYPLNLNEASQEALESLPGIGPSKAIDIIAYRDQHGPLLSVDDLLNVQGIGPATLEEIREYLIVEP
jgi:competence protein ComEA